MSGIFDENFFECGKLTRVCVFCDFGKKSEIFCQSKPRSILKANVCQFAICLSNHRSSRAKNQKHCVCFVVGLWRGLWKSKKYSSKIPDINFANGDRNWRTRRRLERITPNLPGRPCIDCTSTSKHTRNLKTRSAQKSPESRSAFSRSSHPTKRCTRLGRVGGTFDPSPVRPRFSLAFEVSSDARASAVRAPKSLRRGPQVRGTNIWVINTGKTKLRVVHLLEHGFASVASLSSPPSPITSQIFWRYPLRSPDDAVGTPPCV